MSKLVEDTFWYDVTLLVLTKGHHANREVRRQGTLLANGPLQALDKLHKKCGEDWNGTIIKAKICTIDENGEVVATTSMSKSIVEHTKERSQPVTKSKVNEWATKWIGPLSFPTLKLSELSDEESAL